MIALLICFWLLIGTAVYVFERVINSFPAPLVLYWLIWPFVFIIYFSTWIEDILDRYFN